MNPLDRKEFEFLTRVRARPCVSILLPTHNAGPDVRQDPIRLKNLAKLAESRLREVGIRPNVAREILSPVWRLTERNGFWRFQERGLAIFLAEGLFHYFRVPITVEEMVFRSTTI